MKHYPNIDDECDACGCSIQAGKWDTPTGRWTEDGCLLCADCERDMAERGVKLNPAWVAVKRSGKPYGETSGVTSGVPSKMPPRKGILFQKPLL